MNKVYIAIPTKSGQIYFELMMRILKWSHQSIPITINVEPFMAPIDHCRNSIVQNFLTTDCTHLMMIDDDIVPPDDALERLLFYDKPIIAAVCPIIGPGDNGRLEVKYNAYIKKNGEYTQHVWPNSSDIEEVDAVGTGCIMIKREVLEKGDLLFMTEYDSAGIKWQGEDIFFCESAKDKGIPIYAEYKLKCKHIKACNLLELQ